MKLSLTFLTLALSASLASAVEVKELIAERDRILSPAVLQEISQKDPLLHEWLNNQFRITDNLAAAIAADPLRAESMKGDFQFLLSRYKAELDHFRTAPVLDRQNALNVKDFGAVADGVTDDGPAIRAAIKEAVASQKRVVFLPKGRYKVGGDPAKPGCNLAFSGIQHLLVYGEDGTELQVHGALTVPVSIEGCDDVRLENLRVTFVNRPFVTGVVKERLSDDTLRCELDSDAMDPCGIAFQQAQSHGLMRFYSPSLMAHSKRPSASSILPHQSGPTVTKVEGRIYDFKMKNFLPLGKGYAPGVRFAMHARTWGNHAVSCFNSTRLRLIKISLNSSSAMAFCLINNERPFIADCTVKADDDTFVSTAADGIYLRGGSLGGLVINNTIANIGDDFMNIHSLVSPAYDGEHSDFVLKKQWFPQYLREGARIGLIPSSQGINEPTIEGVIDKLTETEHNWRMHVSCDFGTPVTWVKLSQQPALKKSDFLVLLDNLCHGLVIKNNHFSHGLSRFLAGGRNWVFMGNTVDDSMSHSFFMNIGPEPGANENAELAVPRNIEISGNKITTAAKSLFYFGGSLNQFRPINPERPSASHIRIVGNTINVYGKSSRSLIHLKNAAFITIDQNHINAFMQQAIPAITSNAAFTGTNDIKNFK